jgi:hypothetical protein
MNSASDADRLQVWKWNEGDGHIIQAYTHPGLYDQVVLKIKRYSRHSYYNASNSGAHQMLYNSILPKDATLTDIKDILAHYGWPGSDVSNRNSE